MKLVRLLIPLCVVATVASGAFVINRQRHEQRSVLSGVWESQPTQVASRTGGRVKRIVTPEGTRVKVGDLVLELDAGPSQEDADALEARAAEAEARYQELRAGSRSEDVRRQEAVVAELGSQLAKLRNGPRPAELGQARARLEQARAGSLKAENGPRREEVERARVALEQSRSRLSFTGAELKRYSSLWREEAISRQQYDRVRQDYDLAAGEERRAQQALLELRRGTRTEDRAAARAEVEALQQQLSLLEEGSRSEDVQAAEARVAQAQALLDSLRNGYRPEQVRAAQAAARAARFTARSARHKVEEFQVKAPRAGQVERVLVAVGDLVQPDFPLLRTADPDDIWLRVYVPEDHLPQVKVGDPAELRLDGPAGPVAARVESVSTQGEFTPANLQTPEDRGKQVFAVRLRLAQANPAVKAGMGATVKSIGGWQP